MQAAIHPDYALPLPSAPLGLVFSNGQVANERFRTGAFVGMHGSWNRGSPAGYKVVFVPFDGGQPSGAPIDFVTVFQADGKTMGRPVSVAVSPRGELFGADDLANRVWPSLAPRMMAASCARATARTRCSSPCAIGIGMKKDEPRCRPRSMKCWCGARLAFGRVLRRGLFITTFEWSR